jgi:hypothetical protein
MSSTYSTDLRIQLLGPGDQAGTWGNTTNTNLGGIIENAIAGVQSVTVNSTAQALTYLYGAVDQSQGATLVLQTGTVSSAFSIFTPTAASKLYVVSNKTSWTATFYVSTVLGNTTAAGTGVSIPALSTATVYTDGTNFYPQNSYLPGTVTTGGALTVGGAATATSFSGAGTGLTGTATSLSIGGNAATATSATSVTSISSSQQLAIIALAYPVGSIYMNTSNSTNPGTLLGIGTWAVVASGQMLLGNGGGYTAGATGGSATTTIGLSNIPAHTHSISDLSHNHTSYSIDYTGGGSYNVAGSAYSGSLDGRPTSSAFTGITATNNTQSGGTAFPNTAMTTISPYLVVYMWQRTA